MGKKKRKKQILALNVEQTIQHRLRTAFQCTEQEIQLIDKALHALVPGDVAGHLQNILDCKAPLPLIKPKFVLELEDGEVDNLVLNTHHPFLLLYDFLKNHYGEQNGYSKRFSDLYWAAITSPNRSKEYLDFLSINPQTLDTLED